MKKLDINLNYRSGVFNSKNELVLAKACNILIDKVNELVEEVESLKNQINFGNLNQVK